MKRTQRPVFVVAFRAEPRIDAVRSLRGLLKVALRRFGLRAVSVRPGRLPPSGPPQRTEARS